MSNAFSLSQLIIDKLYAVITGVTGSFKTPTGTTAQRDASPAFGYVRANTETIKMEWYNGTTWGSLGGGATGGGQDQVFNLNNKVITSSYSIPATTHASSTGPLTINNGITITVPNGSRWVVL